MRNQFYPTASTSCWYCIHTQRYKERWVAGQLAELCSEVYVPLLRQRKIIRRKIKLVIEPLFPMYIFANLPSRSQLEKVRYTPGVIKIVGTSDEGPVVVDDSIIEVLRKRTVDGYIQVAPVSFLPDEKLEITTGPFKGLTALFQGRLRGGERVAVLLDFLSSKIRVELPREFVQRQVSASRNAPSIRP
jgi:transcriptional antiterminator RfaH